MFFSTPVMNVSQCVQLRVSVKQRIQFLGGLKSIKDRNITYQIKTCAECYAILLGMEPHKNKSLMLARALGLPGKWYKNHNNPKKEIV